MNESLFVLGKNVIGIILTVVTIKVIRDYTKAEEKLVDSVFITG